MKQLLRFALPVALIAAFFVASPLLACPFCSAPSLTLSEQLAQADAAVLVKWVKGEKGTPQKAGTTTYEVLEIAPGKGHESLKKEQQITLNAFRNSTPGSLYFLMGTKGTVIEWGTPMEVTEISYNYLIQAPKPEVPTAERLIYFIKYLEFSETLIANDAYAEFANAPYDDIRLHADKFPAEKLRKWVLAEETPATRLGLYGLMLGLCGNAADADLIQKKIAATGDDFRLGIDGVMSGYLLLTGEKGLKLINDTKLKDTKVPFSETYAAMQALRFLWTYAPERVPAEQLKASMRILLDRPELADLVIVDLARWKDWSIQDKLMKLYSDKDYSIPSIKRAIVRYLLVCSKDLPKDRQPNDPEPPHVVSAKKHLDTLRKQDPKTVGDAERFFFLK